jgi:electron transfer flavoprotein beta subunit
MKCCVLVAYVPDTASTIRIGAAGNRIDEKDIKWILSPFDEYALEEAVRLKEVRGGSVTVLSYGLDRVVTGLRDGIARGADTAVHVKGGDQTFADALAIAKILAAAISKVGPFDLIFTGIQGVGSDNALIGAMVADLLDLPHISGIVKLEVGDGKLVARREGDGGMEVIEAPLPCVLTAQKGLNEPRYPSLKGIMASKRAPIQALTPAELGLDEAVLSGAQATCRWRALALPAAKTSGIVLPGEDAATAARELARLLREQAKVI